MITGYSNMTLCLLSVACVEKLEVFRLHHLDSCFSINLIIVLCTRNVMLLYLFTKICSGAVAVTVACTLDLLDLHSQPSNATRGEKTRNP